MPPNELALPVPAQPQRAGARSRPRHRVPDGGVRMHTLVLFVAHRHAGPLGCARVRGFWVPICVFCIKLVAFAADRPEDDALRFEPSFTPRRSHSQYSAGHSASLPPCLELLASDCCATLVRICTLAFGTVVIGWFRTLTLLAHSASLLGGDSDFGRAVARQQCF